MYAKVSDLPAPVVAALESVRYHRADIEVRAAESVTLGSSGGDGRRAFVTLVDLTAGRHATRWGSWGGPNMFDRTNPVDNDHKPYPLPAHGVAVVGSSGGGGPVHAVLHVPAAAMARMLPAPAEAVTDEERAALYCHHAVKGGAYRRDEMRRRRVRPETVDGLVTRGFLKRNRAGAVAITTEGRNALGNYRGY